MTQQKGACVYTSHASAHCVVTRASAKSLGQERMPFPSSNLCHITSPLWFISSPFMDRFISVSESALFHIFTSSIVPSNRQSTGVNAPITRFFEETSMLPTVEMFRVVSFMPSMYIVALPSRSAVTVIWCHSPIATAVLLSNCTLFAAKPPVSLLIPNLNLLSPPDPRPDI